MTNRFFDWILYGHFWISLAALCMYLQTRYLLVGQIWLGPEAGFIFSGTLLLYSVHRLYGLGQLENIEKGTRFERILSIRSQIVIYALVAAMALIYFFFALPARMRWASLLPGILAMGYVLPVLPEGKRLRDLHYVKIFLIAFCWGWLCVLLPAIELRLGYSLPALLIFVERTLFIFAITLPFDIRDMQIDQQARVRTLPGNVGIRGTRWLAGIALMLVVMVGALSYLVDTYSFRNWTALAVSSTLSYAAIYFCDRFRHDYYFSGLIDGMMILQFMLFLAAGWV